MWALIKREWFIFFSNPLGYLSLGFFLVLSTLFLWFLDTDFNLINAGFADLNSFFTLAPWLFLVLVPTLSMRSFSEEKRLGTLELLMTKPIRLWHIILSKYISSLLLLLTAILPTLIYFLVIDYLKLGDSSIEYGRTITAYLGLFFVGSSYVAIGIFSALVTERQATAFILGLLLCFIQFYLWKGIAELMRHKELYQLFNALGIFEHYTNFRQGVIAIKDIVYFISINYILLYVSKRLLNKTKNH